MQGQVYGPYSHEQMASFVTEGRVIETSLITQNPNSEFKLARETIFFAGESPVAFGKRSSVPSALTPSHQPQTEIIPTSVYLIMAEIGSDQAMRFLHLIQKLGTAQRIGDSVWLLKSEISIESLKLQLSSTLSRQDRLFILDSYKNKTAWHNIGADMGERIDELWGNH